MAWPGLGLPTFKCFEIAGMEIEKGSASSVTVASPRASRATIALRVGSANAMNAASTRSAVITVMALTKPKGYLTVKDSSVWPSRWC